MCVYLFVFLGRWFVLNEQLNIQIMINNNPYNVPEKPLKQSKVAVQSTPLYPYQVNRRQQDIEYKHPPMMKRSPIPYFLQTSPKQSPRIPLSPQPILKTQHLQVSAVTPWENGKQSSNVSIYRELSDRLNQVAERLDLHQRKLSIVMDNKKHQQSTTLSDSTYHSYQITNAFSSKQIQKNLHPQSFNQINTQIAQMLKEEINTLKYQREKYQLRLRKEMKEEMNEQKSLIAQQLISNFRQSLNQKFAIQQRKINESIKQIIKTEDIKLSKTLSQLKESLSRETQEAMKELRHNDNRLPIEIIQRIELMANSFAEHRSQYLHFKDHVFKNILIVHSQEQSFLKLNQKIHLLTKLVQKKQINLYEGFINVSAERSPNQIIKINIQSYLHATRQYQNSKAKILQVTYCIDTDGFLLDSNGFYIINSKGTKIKIEQSQIRKLRDMGILK